MSHWINIRADRRLTLSWHSIGLVPAAPVARRFKITVDIKGLQAAALFVNQPSLDLGGHAMPIAIDRGRQLSVRRADASIYALA